MKKLTKQEQKDEALEAYNVTTGLAWETCLATTDLARKAYVAKCKEIDQQGEK